MLIIGVNTLLIAFTAPLNILEKKFITTEKTFLISFHISLTTFITGEKTDFITLTTPLNNPLKKSIATLNIPVITSHALPNI